MPPKSQVGTSPVYKMAHEDQVRLLSDALLREYMHKKGFRKTLSTFDREHPRDTDTISSRAVMADLMALSSAEQDRLKRVGIETIMEMLCNLRIERRQEFETLEAKASVPVPEVPPECLNIIAKYNQKATEKKDKVALKLQRAEAKKERQNKKMNKGNAKTTSLASVSIPLEKEMTLDDLLESTNPTSTGNVPKDSAPSSDDGDTDLSKNSSFGAAAGKEMTHDIDLEVKEKVGEGYEEACEGGTPCPAEALRTAFKVMCGGASSPPSSFLQQGVSFDDAVGFRLIQWGMGPGAAIASIQAFVVGFYFERSAIESREHQHATCVRALLHILLAAQPDPSRIVIVDGLLSLKHPTHHFQDQLSRFLRWNSFRTTKDVEKCVSVLLKEHWSKPKGCGLWCFLMSLVMSRGPAVVQSDNSGPRSAPPLIDSEGSGTIQLLNLCLCGKAISATHEEEYAGVHLQCGLLLGDVELKEPSHSDDFPPVGTTMNPVMPSWVIRNKKHFSNIFMKKDTRKVFEQKRALGGSASVELTYWDAATDADEANLEVQVSGAAWGGRRKNVNSHVNTALLFIPPWSTAVIDWKGGFPPP